MNGVIFGLRSAEGAEGEARADAWKKVTAKAEQLANQAGLTVRFAVVG